MTFKEELEKDIIPRIQQMVEKERDHLKWLENNNAEKKMIESSRKYLKQYIKRHREYVEYAEQLDDEEEKDFEHGDLLIDDEGTIVLFNEWCNPKRDYFSGTYIQDNSPNSLYDLGSQSSLLLTSRFVKTSGKIVVKGRDGESEWSIKL